MYIKYTETHLPKSNPLHYSQSSWADQKPLTREQDLLKVHRYSNKRDNLLKNTFVDFVTLWIFKLFSEGKKFSIKSLVSTILNIT